MFLAGLIGEGMVDKVVLDNIASGYDLSKVNANFQKIEDELNDKVLYRNNDVVGAVNTVETDIDANGNRIYNLPNAVSEGEPVTKRQLIPIILESGATAVVIEGGTGVVTEIVSADTNMLVVDNTNPSFPVLGLNANAANGVAQLDVNGQIPAGLLPTGSISLVGTFDASGGVNPSQLYPLATFAAGNTFLVGTAGIITVINPTTLLSAPVNVQVGWTLVYITDSLTNPTGWYYYTPAVAPPAPPSITVNQGPYNLSDPTQVLTVAANRCQPNTIVEFNLNSGGWVPTGITTDAGGDAIYVASATGTLNLIGASTPGTNTFAFRCGAYTVSYSVEVSGTIPEDNQILTYNGLTDSWRAEPAEVVVALGNITGLTTFDLGVGDLFTATVTGNLLWSITGAPSAGAVGSFTVELTNAGAFSVDWAGSMPPGSVIHYPGGVTPTLTVAGKDILVFYTRDGGTVWNGFVASLDHKAA